MLHAWAETLKGTQDYFLGILFHGNLIFIFFGRFQAVLNKRFSNSGRRLDRFSTGQSDDMELQAAELWAERGFMPQKPPTIHPAQKKIADLRYSYRAAAYTAQEYSKGTYYVA